MRLYLSDDNLRLLKALDIHRVMCGTRKRFAALVRDRLVYHDGWAWGKLTWRLTDKGEAAVRSLRRQEAA